MTDSPQRTPVRRRVAPSEPEQQGRRTYLWVGGILGVIGGVLFVAFAAGPILRYFFGEANVEPGGAYDIRGLRMEPLDGAIRESEPPVARLELEISLDADHDPFVHDAASWELELEDGVVVPAASAEPAGTIAGGETVTVVLEFTLPGAGEAALPELLRLEEPRTRFEVAHFFEPGGDE